MPKRDYYTVLGVSKTASDKEIKTAYRKLAMQYHPDKLKDGTSDAKMQELNEAYEVLRDPQKRANYDRWGDPEGPQMGAGPDIGGAGGFGPFGGFTMDFGKFAQGFYDFFSGGSTKGGGTTKTATKERGRDVYTEIVVDFMEAVKGKTFKEELPKYILCEHCQGTGADNPKSIQVCKVCAGTGKTEKIAQTPQGTIKIVLTCSACQGAGKTAGKKCSVCNGALYQKKMKSVTFKVAPGSDSGDKIKLVGFGSKGQNGGESGDMIIVINVKPHKYYERKGLDLTLSFPVSFLDIVKENQVKVPTPYGYEKIQLKSSYQTGKTLVLSGKGIKHGGQAGDLRLVLQVVMPPLTHDEYSSMAKYMEPFEDNTNDLFVANVTKEK